MHNPRIGFLFVLINLLLLLLGPIRGGWYYATIWPAMSFAVAGSAYWRFGPAIYDKGPNGTLAWNRLPLLLPYLAYSWSVWHQYRLVKTENIFDELMPGLLFGRRVLPIELLEFLDSLDPGTGTMYIHCAEAHGRTGLFAAALVLKRGVVDTPDDAIARVKAARARIWLNTAQRSCLHSTAELLAAPNTTDH